MRMRSIHPPSPPATCAPPRLPFPSRYDLESRLDTAARSCESVREGAIKPDILPLATVFAIVALHTAACPQLTAVHARSIRAHRLYLDLSRRLFSRQPADLPRHILLVRGRRGLGTVCHPPTISGNSTTAVVRSTYRSTVGLSICRIFRRTAAGFCRVRAENRLFLQASVKIAELKLCSAPLTAFSSWADITT